MTVGNKVTAYEYNKNDELLRTDTLNTDTEEDSVVIYKNDRNRNQLATVNRYEVPSGRKGDTYVDVTLGDNRLNEYAVNHYNALNQLTQTMTKNYKVSFTYDADGLRTSKTVNGEKTVFVWDGDQLVLELSESGKVQKRYVRGNDLVYADAGADSALDEAQERQYYVTDPHGNVVQLTDKSGKVIKTYEYDSFGNEMNPDGKDDNPFRYCGEYYDKETEEVYLRARYYQPAVGRFLTRDTYTGEENEPLSLHLYTYCYNSPILYSDMTGSSPDRPQPGPAPSTPAPTKRTDVIIPQPRPIPTMRVDDFISSSNSEKIAECYLKIARFKTASPLDYALSSAHYKYNIDKEMELKGSKYKKKYITDQSKFQGIKFDTTDMGYAGCELIAIYNALLLKGKKDVSLSEIIRICEVSGYAELTGQWGTNPYRIGKIITECGMKYSVIKSANKLKMKKNNVYIMSFWNSTKIMEGIHTVTAKVKGKNKINTFNYTYSNKPILVEGKFEKLLVDRPFIIGYKLK